MHIYVGHEHILFWMQEGQINYIWLDGRSMSGCYAVRASVRVVTARRVPRQQRMNIMSFGVHARRADDVST